MKINKKEYLKPGITVCFCDTESSLLAGTTPPGVTDNSGGNAAIGGGGTDIKDNIGGKENSGSLWDFENGDEY